MGEFTDQNKIPLRGGKTPSRIGSRGSLRKVRFNIDSARNKLFEIKYCTVGGTFRNSFCNDI